MESKKKILITDDSENLSGVMKELLEFKGYETFVANRGTDAIAIALKEHPDLMLVDLTMPDMNGYEVIRIIRKDPWGKDAKILVLTSSDNISSIPTDIGLDASDYLLKSMWGIEEVEKRIQRELAN